MMHFALTIALGSLTAYLAYRQGKNPYLWFCLGLFFGALGPVLLFFLPKIRKKASKKDSIPTVDIITEASTEKFWYYLDSGNVQFGPMSFDALKRTYLEGKLNAEFFVLNEDLEDWKPFKNFIKKGTSTKKPL